MCSIRTSTALPAFALLLSLLLIPLCTTNASADSLDEAQTLVLKSDAVFRSFMHDPNMGWFHENINSACGIFIVPQMLRGGFILGGSGGSGAFLSRDRVTKEWSYPAFYTMGSLSLGLQIGADASEIILLVMTERGLNAMLSTEFKIGGDISVAAGPIGRNAKAQTVDVLAFGRSMGIFGGVSIEGAVVTPRDRWNSAYYGRRVSPLDILVQHSVRNPQAEQLRKAMPDSGKQQYPYNYQNKEVPQSQYPQDYQKERIPQSQYPQDYQNNRMPQSQYPRQDYPNSEVQQYPPQDYYPSY